MCTKNEKIHNLKILEKNLKQKIKLKIAKQKRTKE